MAKWSLSGERPVPESLATGSSSLGKSTVERVDADGLIHLNMENLQVWHIDSEIVELFMSDGSMCTVTT